MEGRQRAAAGAFVSGPDKAEQRDHPERDAGDDDRREHLLLGAARGAATPACVPARTTHVPLPE
jgi:hypothetical protein